MPRPKKCLCARIKFRPNVVYFKPQGVPMRSLEEVELSIEEIEACRLRHTNGLEQKGAASKMHISQSTYQRTLRSAYNKIADALINSKAIRIVWHK